MTCFSHNKALFEKAAACSGSQRWGILSSFATATDCSQIRHTASEFPSVQKKSSCQLCWKCLLSVCHCLCLNMFFSYLAWPKLTSFTLQNKSAYITTHINELILYIFTVFLTRNKCWARSNKITSDRCLKPLTDSHNLSSIRSAIF